MSAVMAVKDTELSADLGLNQKINKNLACQELGMSYMSVLNPKIKSIK